MISIRHELNDYLLKFGGHIGCSVKKTERKKGYATEMLALALIESKNLNLNKVLITCKKTNIASVNTICNNFGVFDNEVYEKDSSQIFQRYWIYL